MVDTTTNPYLNILIPAKDGAVYVDDYGNTYSEYAPNYNTNDHNVVCFQQSGITIAGSKSDYIVNLTDVKFYYREVGVNSWSITDFSNNPTGTSSLGKHIGLSDRIWNTTNQGGKAFHELIPNFKLFTQYEWYIYAVYEIIYTKSVSPSQSTREDGVIEKIDANTKETSVYTLFSHVRRCIFIPKTTNGSVRARTNNTNTEVYPVFTYSNDRGSTPSAKLNINGKISKIPLVPTGNPLAGKVKIKTNSGVKHFAKRDPSIRDSGLGWTSYGEKYGAYYQQYGTNTPYSYTSGYRQDRVDTLYYYRYLYYNVVDNKAYDRRQEYKEYYNNDKSYAGNYRQYISSYYYVIDSYRTDAYTAYDKQYNKQYITGYSPTAYRTNYGPDRYYQYWAQYRYTYEHKYYTEGYRYYERTYNYPLYYRYTDNRYSRVDNAILNYYTRYGPATGSKSLNLTTKRYAYHSKISTTTKQYYNNAPDSGGANYVLGNYLFRQGNYTGYYSVWTYNPSFYERSSYNYTFTYNYNYVRADRVANYYTYYKLVSSTEREAPNGQYAWNYVEKYGERQVYATTIQYREPVYSSLSYGVATYKITGYTITAYRTNYAYRTEYNGARTNYKQYIDRFHRVDVYRQDLVLQRSYYYTYYWTGGYYHTYPSAYRYDRSAYKTTYNQTPLYGYKYNANYTLSRYYKNYYKSYINMRE